MGVSKKSQVDLGLEAEGKKWVIARTLLKPISTKPKGKRDEEEENDENSSCSTTPRAQEARIPEKLKCPPAPRKRRPSRCNFNIGVREFFTPPDLETVFKLHVEKAN